MRCRAVRLVLAAWGGLLLVVVGVVMLTAAAAAAIHEGYAADAEGRGGNVLPAMVPMAFGLIAIVVGSIAQARRHRAVRGAESAPLDKGVGAHARADKE